VPPGTESPFPGPIQAIGVLLIVSILTPLNFIISILHILVGIEASAFAFLQLCSALLCFALTPGMFWAALYRVAKQVSHYQFFRTWHYIVLKPASEIRLIR